MPTFKPPLEKQRFLIESIKQQVMQYQLYRCTTEVSFGKTDCNNVRGFGFMSCSKASTVEIFLLSYAKQIFIFNAIISQPFYQAFCFH